MWKIGIRRFPQVSSLVTQGAFYFLFTMQTFEYMKTCCVFRLNSNVKAKPPHEHLFKNSALTFCNAHTVAKMCLFFGKVYQEVFHSTEVIISRMFSDNTKQHQPIKN